MPAVDVLDDTFVRAPRGEVRRATGPSWCDWLPALDLRAEQDRGEAGVRWRASASGGLLAGTAEVWLEAVPGGTVVHLYVRLDPRAAPRVGRRLARRLPDVVRRTWKRELHRSKDRIEGGVVSMDEATTGGTEVQRCPSCGSRVSPGQDWCTLCHARLGEPAGPGPTEPGPVEPVRTEPQGRGGDGAPVGPVGPVGPEEAVQPTLPPGAAEAMLAELAATSAAGRPLGRGPLSGTTRGMRTLLAVGAAVVLVAVGVGLLTLVGLLL